MTDWDLQWQERINKVVRRVAKDLIANDETEISEVVRRRLFEGLGSERARRTVARTYADWCFERRAQLPPEWTAVDTAATEAKAREFLQDRFERCYPFHPSTLSVFQRKWQALPQYQQTRGTLAMLAQWISVAFQEGYGKARTEPLITLGSAPLPALGFRGVVLGQLGEPRLLPAIEADIAGTHCHGAALDADTKGPLRDIHRRVGTAILFESSGGQSEKVAHLPELRFALGEPAVDTTSVDTAALALEAKAYFIRRVGSDGFQIRHQPTLKKVVSDRRASLDEEGEVKPAMRNLVKAEFQRGASLPLIPFPDDGAAISDSPRLTLVVLDPSVEWSGNEGLRAQLAEWIKLRGKSPRLYPGALLFCVKRAGRDLREKVELSLAWKRVFKEVADGTLGAEFDRGDRADIQAKVGGAEEDAKDEVWGGYRYLVLADNQEPDGLKVIDLGAGHASAADTLCGRVIAALKAQALLNESVGAGYIERNWPHALKESAAWPLAGLRQSFLNGTLTRLLDPDLVLKTKLAEFVERGDFGLASGEQPEGTYARVWWAERVPPEDIAFEPGVFLLTKARAQALKVGPGAPQPPGPGEGPTPVEPRSTPVEIVPPGEAESVPGERPTTIRLRLTGTIPPEVWNRVGTRLLTKLRTGTELQLGVDFQVTLEPRTAETLRTDIRQALEELGLQDRIRVEQGQAP
jgi:hypothetical protein